MTNGYFELFKEVKKANRGISDKDCHERTSEVWARMPEEEKGKYKRIAKKGKEVKYNSQGIPLDYIEEKQAKFEAEINKENEDIKNMVLDAANNNELVNLEFVLIATNYYCVDLEGQYVTCEVAVVPFSLSEGISEGFHTLIQVDKIPVGFASEAAKQTELHGIFPPPIMEGTDNIIFILTAILKLSAGKPLFCFSSQEKQVKGFIHYLFKQVEDDSLRIIPVYPLSKLFFNLRNALTPEPGFPQISLVEDQLQKDTYRYSRGIECEFHRNTEVYYNCALSISRRWAFTIADHCCKHVGVNLVPGKHVPKKTEANFDIEDAASVKSSVSLPPTYQYVQPKEPEEILKEEKWPSLSGGPPTSTRSQGAIPRSRNTQEGRNAWGVNRNPPPPASSSSSVQLDTADTSEWPSVAPTYLRKRGGRRR